MSTFEASDSLPSDQSPGILLVNDTPATLFALRALLADLGVPIVTADSGRAALRELLKRDFAVILLDVKMADMDGFETARLIRQRPRSRTTPIVFLSAHRTTDLDRARGYALGAVDYLFMPVDPEVLRTKVRAFVELATSQRPAPEPAPAEAAPLQERVDQLSRLNEALRAQLHVQDRLGADTLGETARLLLEQVSDLVAVLDPEGRWLYGSASYSALFGQDGPRVGTPMVELAHPEDRERLRLALRAAASGAMTTRRLHHRLRTPDGRDWDLETRCSAIRDQSGAVRQLLLVSQDLSARKAVEAHLVHMAYHDPLTGLANRLLLQDRLRRTISRLSRRQGRAAILFIDLDRFKDVNDTVGHTGGDRLLQTMAERLQGCVREEDTVARLGGDEFVLLLDEVRDAHQAAWVASEVVAAVSAPCSVEGREIRVTPSVGIVIYPDDGADTDLLLRRADMAMQHSKQLGHGRFSFYEPAMNAIAERRLAVGTALQRGLARHEFVLHYQPKVRLRDRCLRGFEALVRWPQPDGGLILPDEFIGVAEETGRIATLGAWALREACTQMRNWRAAGIKPCPVAVNVSAQQFRHTEDLVQTIDTTLKDIALPPDLLEAEITETTAMEDPPRTVQTLRALRARGIRVAIDDFGTGYSSLAYLSRLPIDKLKIDAGFVRKLGSDRNDRAIVSTIITLAHNLGLKVIAEGVETEAQAELLTELGCDEAQGFLFGRALPGAAAGELIARSCKRQPLAERKGHG